MARRMDKGLASLQESVATREKQVERTPQNIDDIVTNMISLANVHPFLKLLARTLKRPSEPFKGPLTKQKTLPKPTSEKTPAEEGGLSSMIFHDLSIDRIPQNIDKEAIYDKPVWHSTVHGDKIIEEDEVRMLEPPPLDRGMFETSEEDITGEGDIGFHVSLDPETANSRIISPTIRKNLEELLNNPNTPDWKRKNAQEQMDSIMSRQSNLLLKVLKDLKPIRVPDMGRFKNPNSWAEALTVSKYNNWEEFDQHMAGYQSEAMSFVQDVDDPIIIEYLPKNIRTKIYYDDPLSKKEQRLKNNPEQILIRPYFLKRLKLKGEKIDEKYLESLVTMIYDKIYDYKTVSALDKATEDTTQKRFSGKPRRKLTVSKMDFDETKKWFRELKGINAKHGYDSFIYENTHEGPLATYSDNKGRKYKLHADSLMLMSPEQVKWVTNIDPSRRSPKLGKKSGGAIERNPHNYKPKAI